jgi:hypothetical protein
VSSTLFIEVYWDGTITLRERIWLGEASPAWIASPNRDSDARNDCPAMMDARSRNTVSIAIDP